MKAGDDFVIYATFESDRIDGVVELRASVRVVVDRVDGPDIMVLGPMFVGREMKITRYISEDGVEYEVIPT